MQRGEVRLVNLDPVRGAEADKRRPAVIVSNDAANTAAAREAHRNIASFREFQQILEFGLPRNCQAGARKRDLWTFA